VKERDLVAVRFDLPRAAHERLKALVRNGDSLKDVAARVVAAGLDATLPPDVVREALALAGPIAEREGMMPAAAILWLLHAGRRRIDALAKYDAKRKTAGTR